MAILRFGHETVASDGASAGRIGLVVVDSRAMRVTHVGIDEGVLHRMRLAPFVAFEPADGAIERLTIDHDAVRALPGVVHQTLVAYRGGGEMTGAGAGWVPVSGSPRWEPIGASGAGYVSVAGTSEAQMLPTGAVVMRERSTIDESAIELTTHTIVEAATGDALGHLEAVVVGTDGALAWIVISGGDEEPVERLAAITHRTIRVS